MVKVFVVELQEGQPVRSIFQVRRKELVSFREKQGKFLALTLGDKSGEIDAKVWDRAEELAVRFKVYDFIAVAGYVGSYNQKLQLVIDKIKPINSEAIDLAQFLPTTPYNIQELWQELTRIAGEITDPHLTALLRSFLEDENMVKAFCKAPAAKTQHQAYLGGLLEHTVNVLQISQSIAAAYEEIDLDLLIAGTIFHDLGKIYEFRYDYLIDYSDAGRLLGHIVIGTDIIHDKIKTISGFPELLRLKLLHMIVSHHGKYEWQSPKKPKFLEAAILHQADHLDAELDKFKQARENQAGEDNWTPYIRNLERYIFTG